MANGNISGNSGDNSATVTNATDGSGVPSQDSSDVTVTTSNATVSGFGTFFNVTFSGGADTLMAENVPWVNPDSGDSVGFDQINMGSGDDQVGLDRSGFLDLDMGSGDDTLDLVNSGGRSADMGGDEDLARVDLSEANDSSEEELAQKDGQPLLDLDGGSGDDTLELVDDWTVTLSSGDVTIDPENDGLDVTVTNVFSSDDYQNITGFPALLNGTVQWSDPVTLSGGEVAHSAVEFSNFENLEAVCFTAGTLIATPRGETDVSRLSEGDLVLTRNGAKPIQWIGKRRLDVIDLMANPKLLPIRIPENAFGAGLPKRDLYLSPQHRIVLCSKIAERMFGAPEVLAPAKHLIGIGGIEVEASVREVIYYHILLETHEIVWADGLATETLLPGPQAMDMMPRAACDELRAIFPKIDEIISDPKAYAALPLLKGRDSRALIARMKKNGRPPRQHL